MKDSKCFAQSCDEEEERRQKAQAVVATLEEEF